MATAVYVDFNRSTIPWEDIPLVAGNLYISEQTFRFPDDHTMLYFEWGHQHDWESELFLAPPEFLTEQNISNLYYGERGANLWSIFTFPCIFIYMNARGGGIYFNIGSESSSCYIASYLASVCISPTRVFSYAYDKNYKSTFNQDSRYHIDYEFSDETKEVLKNNYEFKICYYNSIYGGTPNPIPDSYLGPSNFKSIDFVLSNGYDCISLYGNKFYKGYSHLIKDTLKVY